MQMTKQDAEAEAIRRWYELPEDMRQTPDDAEIFAQHIVADFQFESILAPDKLLAAWLMRELFRAREAEKAKAAAEAAKIQAA